MSPGRGKRTREDPGKAFFPIFTFPVGGNKEREIENVWIES